MTFRREAALVAVSLLALGSRAGAADTADIESLLSENVVTTASTTAERSSSSPGLSVTLTAEDIRIFGLRTLAEAIDFLGLGVVTSNPLRTPDVGSRGVLLANDDGKHFLLLVNGHAINDPLYGAARFDEGAGVPMDIVDHVEIVVGPGSVLYGSNAMLGVVNVITKNADAYRGVHVSGDYDVTGAWRAGAGTGFSFDLLGAPAEVTAAFEYTRKFGPDLEFDEQRFQPSPFGARIPYRFRRNGPEDGIWGGPLRDAYFSEAPAGLLRFRVGEVEATVMASLYRRGIPYSTASTEVAFDDADNFEQDRAVRLDLSHHATLSAHFLLTSRVYGDAFGYQRRINGLVFNCAATTDVGSCPTVDVGRAHWVGVEEQLSVNWLGDLSLVTLLGVDVRQQWAQAKQDVVDVDTGEALAPTTGRLDVNELIVSPYLQQTYSPAAWLDLNAGARLDVGERYTPVVSPRAAAALHPTRTTTFKATYSEAFRAPTWSETDLTNYRVVNVHEVEPETVRSVEGSIEQRFSTHRVQVGVFGTRWNDLVAAGPLPAAERNRLQNEGRLPGLVLNGLGHYENVASIENYGWNAGWDGTLASGKARYGASWTAAYTRQQGDGTTSLLAIAPQTFGNARFAYAFGGDVPTPAIGVRYVGPRPYDRPFEDGEPAQIADPYAELRFTLTGTVPGLTGLGYRAGVAYLTAKQGAYVAGPNTTTVTSELPGYEVPPMDPAPMERLRAFVGLRYDFFTGPSTGDLE